MDLADSKRLLGLLDEFLRRPEEEWPQALTELRAEEPEIGSALEKMLVSHAAGGSPFSETEMEHAPGRLVGQALSQDDDSIPDRIGPYDIVGLLGHGATGRVFEGIDRTTGERAAVKILRLLAATNSVRKRFEREASLLARLRHPGIASISGTGVENGFPYLAMELIDGTDLQRYAEAHDLQIDECLALMVNVCEAVQHAHDEGILHRDLKPANIMVNACGQPKVLDFGIARAVGDGATQLTSPTLTGQILGTLGYMSPEQCTADHSELDPRCDVYALGVITYELLSRQLPYDVAGKPMGLAIREILEGEAPHLGTVDRKFRGSVEAVVFKAMEKDRFRRYMTAREFGDDMQRVIDGERSLARLPKMSEQLFRLARRQKALVAALVIMLLSLILLAIGGAWFGLEQERLRVQADDRLELVQWELYRTALARCTQALEVGQFDVAREKLEALRSKHAADWAWLHLFNRCSGGGVRVAADNSPVRSLVTDSGGRWVVSQTFADQTLRIDLDGLTSVVVDIEEKADVCAVADDGRILVFEQGNLAWVNPGDDSKQVLEFRVQLSDILDANVNAVLATGVKGELYRLDLSSPRLSQIPLAEVRSACLSADGAHIAALTEAGGLFVIGDMNTADSMKSIESLPKGAFTSVRWLMGDGLLLSSRNSAAVWSLKEAAITLSLDSLEDLSVAADGSRFSALSEGDRVAVYEATGELHRSFRSSIPLKKISISQDGHLLAGRAGSRTLSWDLETNEESRELIGLDTGHEMGSPWEGYLAQAWFVAGRTLLAAPNRSGGFLLWDVDQDLKLQRLRPSARDDHYVYCVDHSPDGTMIATGGWDKKVRIWDAATTRQLAVFDEPTKQVFDLEFHPDGRRLIASTAAYDTEAKLCSGEFLAWDVLTGELLDRRACDRAVQCLEITADGSAMVAVEANMSFPQFNEIKPALWHIAFDDEALLHGTLTVTEAPESPAGVPVIRSLALASDGNTAYTTDHFGRILSWDLVGHDEVHELRAPQHGGRPNNSWVERILWLHQDETMLYSAGNGVLLSFDIKSRAVRKFGDVVPGRTYAMAASPDGARIATGGEDGVLRIWDSRTLDLLLELRGHAAANASNSYIHDLSWSPDGARLISVSGDTTIRFWDTVPVMERRALAHASLQHQQQLWPVVTELLSGSKSSAAVLSNLMSKSLSAQSLGEARKLVLKLFTAKEVK